MITSIRSLLVVFLTVFTCSPAHGDIVSTRATAREIGVTPESLIIADLQSEAALIMGRIDENSAARAALATVIANAAAEHQQLGHLKTLLRFDPGNPELMSNIETSQQSLASLNASRSNLRQMILESALNGLPEDRIARLPVWRIASTHIVPAEFRVLTRTHQEWKRLVRACRSEKRVAVHGGDLSPADAALLAELRARVDVMSAAGRMSVFLDGVKAVFETYS